MNDSQAALLSILSHALFGGKFPEEAFDTDAVLKEAQLQAVLPIAYTALKDKFGQNGALRK